MLQVIAGLEVETMHVNLGALHSTTSVVYIYEAVLLQFFV
jgi:hypothetical protein